MPFYVAVGDDEDAKWVTECPSRCMAIDLLYLPLDNEISCSLHLTGQCLPSLWERIGFSLGVISSQWRTASHRQEMSVGERSLRGLREWLVRYGRVKDDSSPDMVRIDEASGGLDITFEVQRSNGLAFDLILKLRRFEGDDHWFGSIQSGGRGRWRLAWDNIFRKWYVEEWGYLDLRANEAATLISWIDGVLGEASDVADTDAESGGKG